MFRVWRPCQEWTMGVGAMGVGVRGSGAPHTCRNTPTSGPLCPLPPRASSTPVCVEADSKELHESKLSNTIFIIHSLYQYYLILTCLQSTCSPNSLTDQESYAITPTSYNTCVLTYCLLIYRFLTGQPVNAHVPVSRHTHQCQLEKYSTAHRLTHLSHYRI